MSAIRDNWRVGALVILLVASSLALFVPGVGLGEAAADGPTNLQYGLDLSGGTRIQAPLVGWTAEGVDVTQDNRDQLRGAVAENLDGATQSDVAVRFDGETPLSSGGTIEVFRDVSRSEFEAALEAAGVDNSGVREGVTQPTRDTTVDVIQRKIDASGLAGGTVQTSSTPGGEYFVVVEVPNQNSSQVRSLVETRGVVEMVARFPGEGGVRNETVLTQNDITQVSPVQEPNRQIPAPHVPISLTEDGAQRFATSMRENGFTTQQGVSACSGTPPAQQYCLVTVLDGDGGFGILGDIPGHRIVEQQAAVFHKDHGGHADDELGLRCNPKDRVTAHRLPRGDILDPVNGLVHDFSIAHHECDHTGDAPVVCVLGRQGVETRQPLGAHPDGLGRGNRQKRIPGLRTRRENGECCQQQRRRPDDVSAFEFVEKFSH